MKFKVVTTEGATVDKGFEGGGFEKEDAEKDAERRNKRAEKLGVEARYEVVELNKP